LNRISVVGLGKLGLPLAVSLASKGFQVIGVDIDERKVKAINSGISPVSERARTPWKEFEHLEVNVPVINCWDVRK